VTWFLVGRKTAIIAIHYGFTVKSYFSWKGGSGSQFRIKGKKRIFETTQVRKEGGGTDVK
jgi:hypothetical protein